MHDHDHKAAWFSFAVAGLGFVSSRLVRLLQLARTETGTDSDTAALC